MTTYDRPDVTALVDQSHAMFRDLATDLRTGVRAALLRGTEPRDVAMELANALNMSTLTRETFAVLLGIVLTDLDLAHMYRRRGTAL